MKGQFRLCGHLCHAWCFQVHGFCCCGRGQRGLMGAHVTGGRVQQVHGQCCLVTCGSKKTRVTCTTSVCSSSLGYKLQLGDPELKATASLSPWFSLSVYSSPPAFRNTDLRNSPGILGGVGQRHVFSCGYFTGCRLAEGQRGASHSTMMLMPPEITPTLLVPNWVSYILFHILDYFSA